MLEAVRREDIALNIYAFLRDNLLFEMKTAFYGPIDAGKSVIQKSIVNYDLDQADSAGFAFSIEYTPKFSIKLDK